MINGLNYVTLATDASVSMHGDAAGLAYYIRDDSGTVQHAWRIAGAKNTISSTDAEWVALEEAVIRLNENSYTLNTKLIIYCDNSTIIQVVENNLVTNKSKKNWGIKATWLQEQFSRFAEVEARHVKSHTGKTDQKRYYLNMWCDFNARAMLRHGRLHAARRAA